MALKDHIQDIYTCNRCKCGFCREECPSYKLFGLETYSGRGRMSLAWALLEGKIAPSRELAHRIYTCTLCKYCSSRCGMDVALVIRSFREELVEHGLVPPKIREFLENVSKHGNPWGEPRRKRDEWARGIGIKLYEPTHDLLYYVGCVGSYDTRARGSARALGELLLESGVSFGILGSDEECDGNEVYLLGEAGLFRMLAEKNIQKFKELGVKRIVTLSPHAYNAIKNEYPRYGGDFEVMHYTQLLREIIKSGRLSFSKSLSAKVAYHDPCLLGRYNGEYEAPRDVLKSIPGVRLVEMPRSRENSFCCGGGSGNFYANLLDGRENSPGRIRVREAYSVGAEVLAVACPVCLIMLEDALKAEGLEDKIIVRDISEIVRSSVTGEPL